ncbi:MAG: FHA domain-containing protein [Fastidiosipilaceae bacterium]|jgi:hypothetical protein|nr:FHA domain-containing protein [Clostridiaceae bacterium]
MAKLKVKQDNGQITVESRLKRKEKINQQEIDVLSSRLIRGIMRPTVVGKRKLNYAAPQGVTLKRYITKGLDRQEFLLIFVQIVELTKKILNLGFDLSNLVMDLDYTFINEATKEVHFVYQPLFGIDEQVNIFSYIYDLIFKTTFQLNEDLEFVNNLVYFLKNMPFYNPQSVEDYIRQVDPQIYQVVLGSGSKSGAVYRSQSAQPHTYNNDQYDDVVGTVLLEDESDYGTTLLSDSEDSFNQTTILNEVVPDAPYLIRKDNNERIDIKPGVFRLGKDQGAVDYAIPTNNAISRLHAEIIAEGDAYYIRDNHSTNHTYVNGTPIGPNQDTRIFAGDSIMLADQEFDFHIGT